jgi:DUF2075 family protein
MTPGDGNARRPVHAGASNAYVRNGVVVCQPENRARTDASLKGYKALLKQDPVAAREKAAAIIKNTYRTLLTRAQKGCFLYSNDPETNLYLRMRTSLRYE